MKGLLVMSAKERERLKIFLRVKRGELQQKEAAALCRLDYRYLRRLYQRYCQQGDRGLVHQGRGRPSNRAYAAEMKAAVLARYQERYPDFGPTLAAEKLALEGMAVDHETLRHWLMKAGLWQRRRKRTRHRSWRERRAHFGELVQLDGSHHQWFEKRADKCCLMNMVDDAQGTSLSWLAEEETITTDWLVRFANQYYQLQPGPKAAVGKGTVLVRRYLNGELHFCYGGRDLPYTLLPERPKAKTVNKKKSKRRRGAQFIEQYVPPANHVWRSFQFGKDRLGLAEPKATRSQKT